MAKTEILGLNCMEINILRLLVLTFTCAGMLPLCAAPISPVSYDMMNGQTGGYSYQDDTYSGSGNPNADASPLSGGLGQLTDGVFSNQNWFDDPQPWVAWVSFDPVITFTFAQAFRFTGLGLHVDDSNNSGGVTPPTGVTVSDGIQTVSLAISDPPGDLPFWAMFDGLDLLGSSLTVTVHRDTATDGADECSPCQWAFVDEFEFDGAPAEVPEPSTLLLISLPLFAVCRKKRL